jgi:hypothetical protein
MSQRSFRLQSPQAGLQLRAEKKAPAITGGRYKFQIWVKA